MRTNAERQRAYQRRASDALHRLNALAGLSLPKLLFDAIAVEQPDGAALATIGLVERIAPKLAPLVGDAFAYGSPSYQAAIRQWHTRRLEGRSPNPVPVP